MLISVLAAGALAGASLSSPAIQDPPVGDMGAWMATINPGPQHEIMAAWEGKWDTEMRMWMMGPKMPPMVSRGSAVSTLVFGGRFLRTEQTGSMMGMDADTVTYMGYDNFKKKWNSVVLGSTGTQMLHYEGTMDQTGTVLTLFGAMDEPMFDRHDQAVKVVRRTVDEDTHVVEIHDLTIIPGETRVVEFTYRRQLPVAAQPVPRDHDWWRERHDSLKARVDNGPVELLFLGDSITQAWETNGKRTWERAFGARAANFAISGDRTQHQIWRLQDTDFSGIRPLGAVIMIGTNNAAHDEPADVARGVKGVVREVQRRLPETGILLLAVFPRGAGPDDPLRMKNEEVNRLIAPLADGDRVRFLDIADAFLEEDGTLSKEVMPDLLHLSKDGYRRWASAIAPEVDRLLGDPNASGGDLRDDQACFDVLHIDLDLAIDPDREWLGGTMTMGAQMTKSARRISLDLDNRLAVSRVEVDGEEAEFTHSEGRIVIEFGERIRRGSPLSVAVDYAGHPRAAIRAPWDGGLTWSRTKGGEPWIATTCQGEGADLWWPVKDHPSDKPDTMNINVTVPSGLVVATNGLHVDDTDNDDGTITSRWRVVNPVSAYNVALNIGPYDLIESTYQSVTGEAVPASFWVLPEDRTKAEAAQAGFHDVMRHLEETLGPYPFRSEKYGVVQTPHLGMEHQTINAYGNGFRTDSRGYDWLHAHELSHEWWGNLVTVSDWQDMWIHEGIGTYMQGLYKEDRFGRDAYLAEASGWARGLNNRRAVAPRESHDSKQIYFLADGGHDNDIYSKGALVCHSLRWLLGDDVFFTVLRRWAYPDPATESVTDGSQVRFETTDGLLAIAEQHSGLDLDWFWEVYLRQPDLPVLEVTTLTTDPSKPTLSLNWQAPGDLPFPMPVPVTLDGEQVRVEMPNGRGSLPLSPDAEWSMDLAPFLLAGPTRRIKW